MQTARVFWRSLITSLGMGLMVCTAPLQAQAAEQITLIIGPLNRSIQVSELRRLAETGEVRGDLKTILKVSGQSPEAAGRLLTQSIPFDLVVAYNILTSSPGEALLSKLGQILAPRRSNTAGLEALRSAILLSLSEDNEMSILELLERYPTDARINVGVLLDTMNEFGDLTGLLGILSGN